MAQLFVAFIFAIIIFLLIDCRNNEYEVELGDKLIYQTWNIKYIRKGGYLWTVLLAG